ncbi:MAG: Rab family GTPase [Pseudanabaenaceae cyanobacterium bins.68]|nr:Rab family GTPase [Pseudanabaenaceae cyanobacterium bins.68]
MIAKKICLIGDFGVGKTSLVRRYVESCFSDAYLSTVGVKIARKTLEVSDRLQNLIDLQLMLWDIEGSTKFKSISTSYLQGAKGAIIVADASRPETVTHVSEHIQTFTAINPQGQVMVAINKSDLVIKEELAKMLQLTAAINQAKILGIYATSAKTGDNVDQMFHQIATEIIAIA